MQLRKSGSSRSRWMSPAVLLALPGWAGAQGAPAGAGAGVAAEPSHAPESAVWAPKQTRFIFQGFTAHYSCDGLAHKVRKALLQLGARPDLTVREVPCSSPFGRPDPFPGVTINMQVLVPLDAKSAPPGAPPVRAQWKTVTLRLDRDPVFAAGDCELVEQIKQSLLPLFTTRNVNYSSNCIPNQVQAGGTWLRTDVLVPLSQAAPHS
jgi:hypothetical protein